MRQIAVRLAGSPLSRLRHGVAVAMRHDLGLIVDGDFAFEHQVALPPPTFRGFNANDVDLKSVIESYEKCMNANIERAGGEGGVDG